MPPAFVFLLTKAGGFLYFDERNDEPMLFISNSRLRELEQLMQGVPNFPPKGHGILIIKRNELLDEDRMERIKAGTATAKEVLTETLSSVAYPPFQRRLRQYIKESEMNPMDSVSYTHLQLVQRLRQRRLTNARQINLFAGNLARGI